MSYYIWDFKIFPHPLHIQTKIKILFNQIVSSIGTCKPYYCLEEDKLFLRHA